MKAPLHGKRPPSGSRLEVRRLGRVPYREALELQHALVEQRAQDLIEDQLLLLEHDPVLTVGRGERNARLEGQPLPVVEIERGGAITYHGPGQLVGYPILKLAPGRRDLHRYLRQLESVLIRVLRELGLEAVRNPPHTGVWVADRKLVSIGVAVRRWVTFHGFALNLSPELAIFRSFRPCGLPGELMSSLSELRVAHDREQLIEAVSRAFAREFQFEVLV